MRGTGQGWLTTLALAAATACSGGSDAGGGPPAGPPAPAPVARVEVTLGSASIVAGQTTQATAVPRDASGTALTGRSISWSSSAPGVATVSQNGLVTGVGAGAANIVATSEGQTGTAPLTVTPDPVAAVTLAVQGFTANGSAVDITNLAGAVDLALDAALPAGATARLTVSIGTRILHESTLPAPALDGVADNVLRMPVTVALNFADYTATVSGETIRADALRNGPQDVVSRLVTTVAGQSVTRQVTTRVTLNQVDTFVGFLRFGGASVTTSGRLWESGELQLRPVFVSYSGHTVDDVRLAVGDAPTQPGAYAQARVVREVTRNGAGALDAIVRIPLTDLPGESPAAGTQVWLAGYRVGGTMVDPRIAIPNAGGHCAALAGSGFASAAAPAQLPAGCTRFQLVPSLAGKLADLATTHRPASATLHYDHLGPVRLSPGVFTLRSRVLAVGQPATDASGVYGVTGNWVGVRYNLRDGLNLSRVTDGGAGLDQTATPPIYAGPQNTASALKVAANMVTAQSLLPVTSGAGVLYALATVNDRLGNSSDFWVETTAANPLTDGLVVDPSPNDGTRAILRVAAAGGTATPTGVPNNSWTRTTNPGWTLGATFTGAVAGYPANFASLLATHVAPGGTATRLIGNGSPANVPTVIGGTGGSSSGSVSYPFSQLAAAAPGTREGFYRFRLCGVDNAGLPATFPAPATVPRAATSVSAAPGDECGPEQQVAVDLTRPSTANEVTPPEPLGGPSPQTVSAQVTDNMAAAMGIAGAEYRSFTHSSFDAGFVYAPIVWQLFAQDLLVQQLTGSTIFPWALWLTNSSGALPPGSPGFLLTHLYHQAYDRAGNASGRRSSGVGPLPTPPQNPIPALASMIGLTDAATVCVQLALLACSGNPYVANYSLQALSQLQQQLFDYIVVYAILQSGAVHPVCKATLLSVIAVGALYQQTYGCSNNWRGFNLGGPGRILLALMGVTRQGYGIKYGRFLDQNLH